jgi:hypothetical protein
MARGAWGVVPPIILPHHTHRLKPEGFIGAKQKQASATTKKITAGQT